MRNWPMAANHVWLESGLWILAYGKVELRSPLPSTEPKTPKPEKSQKSLPRAGERRLGSPRPQTPKKSDKMLEKSRK